MVLGCTGKSGINGGFNEKTIFQPVLFEYHRVTPPSTEASIRRIRNKRGTTKRSWRVLKCPIQAKSKVIFKFPLPALLTYSTASTQDVGFKPYPKKITKLNHQSLRIGCGNERPPTSDPWPTPSNIRSFRCPSTNPEFFMQAMKNSTSELYNIPIYTIYTSTVFPYSCCLTPMFYIWNNHSSPMGDPCRRVASFLRASWAIKLSSGSSWPAVEPSATGTLDFNQQKLAFTLW